MIKIQIPKAVCEDSGILAALLNMLGTFNTYGVRGVKPRLDIQGETVTVDGEGLDLPRVASLVVDELSVRFGEPFTQVIEGPVLTSGGVAADVGELVPGPKTLTDPASVVEAAEESRGKYNRRKDELEGYLLSIEAASSVIREALVHVRERL